MPNETPINTASFQQFIQQVKEAENSQSKEVKLTITQAKNLSFNLGIAMSRLYGDLEEIVLTKDSNNDEVININVDSGSTW